MQVVELSGTHREMGAAYGEACREDIVGLYTARVSNAIEQAKAYGGRSVTEADLITIAKAALPMVKAYHEAGYEELEGIASGSNRSLEQTWVMNALTDLRDIAAFGDVSVWAAPADGEGCSSFIMQGDRTQDGTGYVGQTWDLSTSNMPFVRIVKRKPTEGPATVCLSTVGCLSLIGMNEHGVSIGTTNIRSVDAKLGVCYLDIIHKVLHQQSLAAAVEVITGAPRAGAHYYYVMDAEGAAAVECTASQHATVDVAQGAYVHCNHVLEASNLELEAKGTPVLSSSHRQGRMAELVAQAQGPHSIEGLQAFFADHDGDERGICRHDVGGISSNGSVIMNPASKRLWAVHGPACTGTWAEHQL